jgi:hypothetical protein
MDDLDWNSSGAAFKPFGGGGCRRHMGLMYVRSLSPASLTYSINPLASLGTPWWPLDSPGATAAVARSRDARDTYPLPARGEGGGSGAPIVSRGGGWWGGRLSCHDSSERTPHNTHAQDFRSWETRHTTRRPTTLAIRELYSICICKYIHYCIHRT